MIARNSLQQSFDTSQLSQMNVIYVIVDISQNLFEIQNSILAATMKPWRILVFQTGLV